MPQAKHLESRLIGVCHALEQLWAVTASWEWFNVRDVVFGEDFGPKDKQSSISMVSTMLVQLQRTAMLQRDQGAKQVELWLVVLPWCSS